MLLPSPMRRQHGAVLAPFLLLGSLAAQIPIGGNQTGTLAAGIYHATSTVTVPAGQTLTLAPGVILKFSSGYEFSVLGTLIANGTAANPVICTDLQDDSAGGDSNGNGPSNGAPTAWRGIVFQAGSDASSLHYLDARYGGSGFVANFYLNSTSPTFDNCTSRNNYTLGMSLNGSSLPTVTNCTFADNGNLAIDNVPIAALPGFTNNTASGAGAYARVNSATVNGSLLLSPANMINGAVVLDTNLIVPSGSTLTLAAGLVIKMRSASEITVHGTLHANGTSVAPVVVTDLRDDSIGGDTNTNGASSGVPAGWRGIVFQAGSDASSLHYLEARYGGSGFVSNFHLDGTAPSLDHCTSRFNYTHGMNLNGSSSPTVSNCSFVDNGGFAIEGIATAALAGLANNTASGNGTGNYGRVTVGNVSGTVSIPAAAMINGAVVLDTNLVVPSGNTLVLAAGVVLKMRSAFEITIDGTLLANGTAVAPVVVTDLRDDSAGGDTNSNGASNGVSASWRGIVFGALSGNSTLRYLDARYGGSGFVANFYLNSASPTLEHCTSRNNYTHGMTLNGNSTPTVRECTFVDNGGYAIEDVPLTAVPGFTNNHASGNSSGNFLRVTNTALATPLTIGSQSCLNGALVLATNLTVLAGGDLTLQQGVVVKMQYANEVIVDGALHARGSGFEPVVFTDLRDDEFGGDTNGNGPSSGQPATWRGLTIPAGAAASSLEHVRLRYCGSGFVAALTCSSPLTTLRSVRADRANSNGLVLAAAAGTPCNLVAWGCGSFGIQLTAGSFAIAHATANGNGTGMRRENAWTGQVVNSISRGNSTDFANFPVASQVIASCGTFAGQNGNLVLDPQFVDAPNGDLHLQTTSPCLGVADVLAAIYAIEDFEQNSRLLDHALIGLPLPDMGAHELGAWDMTVSGETRPGQVLDYTVTGGPGVSFYLFGVLDGLIPVVPFGFFLAGGSATVISPPTPTGATFQLPVPPIPGLVGLQVGIQSLTFPIGSVAVGNLTRLHRLQIRP